MATQEQLDLLGDGNVPYCMTLIIPLDADGNGASASNGDALLESMDVTKKDVALAIARGVGVEVEEAHTAQQATGNRYNRRSRSRGVFLPEDFAKLLESTGAVATQLPCISFSHGVSGQGSSRRSSSYYGESRSDDSDEVDDEDDGLPPKLLTQTSSLNMMTKQNPLSKILYMMCMSERQLPAVLLTSMQRYEGGVPHVQFEAILGRHVRVDNLQWSGAEGGDNIPMESLSLTCFEITFLSARLNLLTGEADKLHVGHCNSRVGGAAINGRPVGAGMTLEGLARTKLLDDLRTPAGRKRLGAPNADMLRQAGLSEYEVHEEMVLWRRAVRRDKAAVERATHFYLVASWSEQQPIFDRIIGKTLNAVRPDHAAADAKCFHAVPLNGGPHPYELRRLRTDEDLERVARGERLIWK